MMKRILIYLGIAAVCLGLSVVTKGESKEADYRPFVELREYNTVVLRGRINWRSASSISNQLLRKANNRRAETIYLVLDSGGGSIVAGNSIIATMKAIQKPIVCIALFAASMAHGILQNCTLRYITEDGVSMIHRARGGFQGYFNDGEVESQLKLWKAIVTKMEKQNAKRMNLEYEEYKRLAANEFWCSGEECVKNNFVSYLIDIRCSTELLAYKIPVGSGFNIKGYLSGCPLIRGLIPR